MKLSVHILIVALAMIVAQAYAADAIKKNLERRVLAQELTQQKLTEQLMEIALKDIDTSGMTVAEFEQFQKQVAELLSKELVKGHLDPKHARSSSI